MIKTLCLQNIKSHEDSTLEFHPGVNIIRGESDQGKTNILRALYWLRYNRPLGDSIVSNWTRKDGGETAVTITTENHTVRRFKGKENGYQIDKEEPLTAIKTEVPEQVIQTLNFSESAIHRQFDGPFLLDESPGEVARYFNRIVRMDIIDTFLSLIDSKKRETSKELKIREADLIAAEKELEQYDWVEKADSIYARILRMDEERESVISLRDEMNDSFLNYKELEKKKDRFQRMEEAERELEKIEPLFSQVKEIRRKKEILKDQYEDYALLSKKNFGTPEKAEKLLAEIDGYLKELREIRKQKEELQTEMEYYTDGKETVKELKRKIETLEEKMPEICPVCGGKL